MNIFNKLVCSLLLILAAACTTTPEKPKEIPPRPARESITRFSVNARAIIQQASKANTVRILWEHSPQTDNIGFASSMSGMIAELQRTPAGARWTTAEGEEFYDRNADMLIARLTDTPVPIAELALWITGQISPKATGVERDPGGRLLQAQDSGWSIRVLNYETDLPSAMPSVMEVQSGELRIRLAFEEYQL